MITEKGLFPKMLSLPAWGDRVTISIKQKKQNNSKHNFPSPSPSQKNHTLFFGVCFFVSPGVFHPRVF